ncbi:PadR family transcriptional regulator [Streptomyces sp. TRM68416]|uniref:PadR family transcriptional regulator n=1 Tax=Streptomyces sp. TRM68416 TaxID=2758412 RepID=UPI001661ABF2|nr:PadR family transcriptional regulator [Streptomyces sp. TRM68416]MBD0842323.1 PadR family transcriptional regulator [Streptomyces sp. TRM68416]
MNDTEIPPTVEPADVRAVPPVAPRAESALPPEPAGAAASMALRPAGPSAGVTALRVHKPGRGDIRTAALTLLAEEEQLNGNQVVQRIAERSQGAWRPSPGAVYPALEQLEKDGLIEPLEGGRRRGFRLTEAGRIHVAENRVHAEAVWRGVAFAGDARIQGIDTLCEHVVTAVRHALYEADDDRYAEVRGILVDARRSLYRLLAE